MPINALTLRTTRAGHLRIVARAFLFCVLQSTGVSAETPVRAPHQSIDHAAACGFFQLRKEFRRAIEHCDAALRDDRDNPETLSNRGGAHFALGNLEEALDDFNAAMRVKPRDARNHFNRALVYAARNEHQRAIADYDEAIRLMPTLAVAHNNRAREFEAIGERDKAIADYRRALLLAPSLSAVIGSNLRRLGVEP